jgi:DNA-binding transcriptional LysR family regulator
MDRFSDISLFIRVLDTGSISAAARSLDMSTAVASARLKRLERGLGVRLLHRTTRRLRPTAEGMALAGQGRSLVEDLEALTSNLRQSGRNVTGTLRVTVSATFGREYISPLLPAFLNTHPGLRMSMDLSDLVVDLPSGGFDLAIRIGELEDSSLIARKLATNRRVICASPDYLRRHGTPRTPADLQQHECLLLVGTQGRRDTWKFGDGKRGQVSVRVSGRIECNQGELLRDAAVAGLGIAMHSSWHVVNDLRAGRLKPLLTNYPLADTGIYALTPQRRLVPQRVRAFIDYLAESFGDVPPWERRR